MSHTLGPWWVDIDDEDDADLRSIWVNTGDPDEPVIVAEVHEFGLDFQRYLANARLIAAAPELLEALESLAYSFVRGSGRPTAAQLKAAEAAIAKARP